MKTSWRLFYGITLITVVSREDVNDFGVILVPTEKIKEKSYISSVFKESGNPIKLSEITITEEDQPKFSLFINDELHICIKSDYLPDKNKYYRVFNFYGASEIGYLLSELNCEKGFFNYQFSPIFSSLFQGLVKFTCESLSNYKECFNELNRVIKCDIFKKTKKWIPGHKYDSEKSSFIYLGEYITNINYGKNLKRIPVKELIDKPDDYKKVYLIKNEITDEKKISDVFKNSYISSSDSDDGIYFVFKMTQMVDSGQVLEDDSSSISLRNYWDTMIDNGYNKVVTNNSSRIKEFNTWDISSIYDNICFFSKSDSLDIKDCPELSKLRLITLDLFRFTLLNEFLYKDIFSLGINNIISFITNKTIEEKDDKLITESFYSNLFTKIIGFTNTIYQTEVLEYIKRLLSTEKDYIFDKNNIKNINSVEEYENVVKYIYDLNIPKFSRQRFNSTSYTLETIKIKSLFSKDSKLPNILIDIVKDSLTNYGVLLDYFVIKDVGTVKNPRIYASMEITIKNIKDYFDGNIPEEIFMDIKDERFYILRVDIDFNIDFSKIE